ADRFETVVVLDDCSDDSAELVRSLEVPYSLTLLEPTGPGSAARSRNAGAEAAVNPIVLFLDDDGVPEPDVVAVRGRAHRLSQDDHVALGYCPPAIEGDSIWCLTLRAWWE